MKRLLLFIAMGLMTTIAQADSGSASASQSGAQAGAAAQSGAAAIINIGGGGNTPGQTGVNGASSPAIAGGSAGGGVGIGVGGSASSQANNAQYLQFNTEAVDLGKTVPGHVAPGLTTSFNSTCVGSTSGGLSIAGAAISGGSTRVDAGCEARQNAGAFYSMGFSGMAVEILCSQPNVFEAAARMAKTTDTPSICPGMDPEGEDYSATSLQVEYDSGIVLSQGEGEMFVDAWLNNEGMMK